ncbi:hypothetical protein Pmani_031875 [Petrolisthes manimaculis]|uniref:Uncharacterized protein n=1 Tax=Petrolisthes manimaculis TaxID=1843537 RepID=A0AAE1TRZ1_9EUCA|nr:hypothetical protein Pmani_031875 [Petrolisthes manimaculis]
MHSTPRNTSIMHATPRNTSTMHAIPSSCCCHAPNSPIHNAHNSTQHYHHARNTLFFLSCTYTTLEN